MDGVRTWSPAPSPGLRSGWGLGKVPHFEAHRRTSPTKRGEVLGQLRKKQCCADSDVGETHSHLGENVGFNWALVICAAVGARDPWPPEGQTGQDKNSELDSACWK